MGLVERAATARYETLVVTVDVPVAGARRLVRVPGRVGFEDHRRGVMT